jgi:hypothetical protein
MLAARRHVAVAGRGQQSEDADRSATVRMTPLVTFGHPLRQSRRSHN